jgi:deoxyribonuclease IV
MPRMLPDGRRLGAHLPLGHGMVKAVDRAHAIGADALQVFADNPTAWRRRSQPPREAPAFRARLAELDIGPVAMHAAYLVNLAGPEDDLFSRSIEVLTSDLVAAPTFAARFVNVHIGSHRGAGLEAGIARLAEGLAAVLAQAEATRTADGPPAMIVLENSPGSGFGIGSNVTELAAICAAVADRGIPRERVGFCLDAAHAWAAGIDLSLPEVTDVFLADFDAHIGLDRLAMVHLNDSKGELGSRFDRHDHLGAGRIGVTGLRHLLTHPSLRRVTYYLETPGMDAGFDAVNVARAYEIAAGQPLTPLPPGADDVTSDRSRTGPPLDDSDEPVASADESQSASVRGGGTPA